MNYGRGFGDTRCSWIPAENRIGRIGETPGRPIMVDDGVVCGRESESWMAAPVGRRGSWVQERGIVRNSDDWNPVLTGNGGGGGSWTPVTPGKQPENLIPADNSRNQLENENWEDLVGIYQDLLKEETPNLNVVQDLYSTPPPNTAKRNLNPILNSSPGSTPNPSPNPNHVPKPGHASNQAPNSLSWFPSKDPANWEGNLLEAIVRPKRRTQVGSNSIGPATSVGPMLGTPRSQTLGSNSNKLVNGYNSKQLPKEGLQIPYRPSYNLNSPPRSEPDAASSGITGPLPFAPITSNIQQKQMGNQWVPVNDQRNDDTELLQAVGDSTSSAVSTTRKEHLVSEEGDETGIDLNKTPQQKTPARRKKHRPKVIREGKLKRTPKPKDPKNANSDETRVKRKYVRKKGLNSSETPIGNGVAQSTGKRKYVRRKGVENSNSNSQQKTRAEEVRTPSVKMPVKTCKKQLNFDLECVVREGQEDINLNAKPQDIEQERRINSVLERSAMKIAQNGMYIGIGADRGGTQNPPVSEPNGPHTPLAKARDHALNVLARNLTMRNSFSGYNLEGGSVVDLGERRGIKRQSFEPLHSRNLNAVDSLLMYQKLLLGGTFRADDRKDSARIFLESRKKTKTQGELPAFVPSATFEGNPRGMNGVYGNVSALQLLNSCTGRMNPGYKLMNGGGGRNVDHRQFRPPMAATQNLQRHPMLSGVQPVAQRSSQGRGIGSVNAMVSWNTPPATPLKKYSRSAVVTYPATLLDKKQNSIPNSSNQRLNGPDKMLLQFRKDTLEVQQQSFMNARGGPRKQKFEVSVEDITSMLEGLCIYDENEKQNALVPYRGQNAIIPFEPIKKRKPRPKVDLDPETDRLWRLLMGKEGSEGTETLDKDKEKWWEDERRVFRGRADSFIARMHLVQGDRRFSRWKGSVVDSVIGVFLTQNVSDHLSSSAFMSLAAKFSLKSTTTNETCCQDGACILVEEPINTVLPNDHIGRHPLFNQGPFVSCESSEHIRNDLVSSTKIASNKHNRTSEEEAILSQDSLDSSTIQTVDEIRSSSASNSEAEDQTTGHETSKMPGLVNLMRAEKVSMFKELFSHDNWSPSPYMHHLEKTPDYNMQIPRIAKEPTSLQNVGSSGFGLLGGESVSSLPSSNSRMTEAYHTSNLSYQQNEIPRFQMPPLGQYDFLSNHPTRKETFQPGAQMGGRHFDNNHQPGTVKSGAQKHESCAEDRVSAVDKQNGAENASVEANSKEQNSGSHEPLSGEGTNVSKVKKGTAEDEKNKAFDWDSLRKKVLEDGGKRERSKDAKDSLDYEALRRAHVNEISDAIRERGMNNMLADRIKGFLDRLVNDHGSIDLEWLRDVPPDKAKDYLLSIRGLGLKSVECVRLLTLHHLAFPVDTNVGRIAVRLGWVPLQPLPESLQLHLLEMYPVLESIQKYIWPRLCKLDQLTLYELHYQMITFGKVFCTKSKPNCNACPMRAECRHFASAFASARLSLPGPEEKRMVPSNAPIATDTTPPVISRPMPLPLAENNYNKDAGFFGRGCEPIIEEPSTPEPETAELSISDIEDQYYDDSDEIPTIKLDMKEFTTNLQKVQDGMELQGDLSKALVALNPQAASIPTQKLKNVSRLRTEHQVYELPDSHPILEGLDKREPDDPSPYLLAIWTPGETANSIQPPERGCQAQETGKLCERTTCFSCNTIKEAYSQVVRGTILVPCRTAMRGSFPLNGTYFQVNEMFADHASSLNPIDVPRAWIWNLPRRTVYFGTSVSTIFKGLTTPEIQLCFWRGFVCVRGFDQKTRAPRPLMARLHFPASKLVKTKNEGK